MSTRNQHASRAATSLRRLFTSESNSSPTLQRWMQGWTLTPPVTAPLEGMPATAAGTWARRHGPPLSVTTLHKLFREKKVRVWDPVTDQVRRASKDSLLAPGARLLLPKEETTPSMLRHSQGQGREEKPGRRGGEGHHQHDGPITSYNQRNKQHSRAIEDLRSRVLFNSSDKYLAINKPPLAVQGGAGVAVSIDTLLPLAFPEEPELKLVHRLDKSTTGALLIAKGADAATLLGTAFRRPATAYASKHTSTHRAQSRGAYEDTKYNNNNGAGLTIEKTYWAVVCKHNSGNGGGNGSESEPDDNYFNLPGNIPSKGTIDASLEEHGSGPRAVSRFRVLQEHGDVAWLELIPVTGRKHQLRIHCAKQLGTPVLGDSRYGAVRGDLQKNVLERLLHKIKEEGEGERLERGESGGSRTQAWPPLMLHCRRLVVKEPGKSPVNIVAPLPPVWRSLFKMQGWRLPEEFASRP